MFRAGEALLGEWCSPALMVAAACSEDKDGDLGDGGLDRKDSALLSDIRRGLCCIGEPGIDGGRDDGSEFRSGGMLWRMQGG